MINLINYLFTLFLLFIFLSTILPIYYPYCYLSLYYFLIDYVLPYSFLYLLMHANMDIIEVSSISMIVKLTSLHYLLTLSGLFIVEFGMFSYLYHLSTSVQFYSYLSGELIYYSL